MSLRSVVITASAVVMLTSCVDFGRPIDWHQHDSYSGWVTDAATGEPIEGAVVLIEWVIFRAELSLHSSGVDRLADLEETVTDKDGWFEFAPIGDYSPPPFWSRRNSGFPRLLFFKPGYEHASRQRYTWEFGEQAQFAPNLRGIPLRKEGWKREIPLYRNLTGPLTGPRPHDPLWRDLPDEQKILNFITNIAFSLGRNVEISASDLNPFQEAERRKAVQKQWRTILMIDAEIRKYRPNYRWSNREIREALAAVHPAQKPPPKTVVRPSMKKQPARPESVD